MGLMRDLLQQTSRWDFIVQSKILFYVSESSNIHTVHMIFFLKLKFSTTKFP